MLSGITLINPHQKRAVELARLGETQSAEIRRGERTTNTALIELRLQAKNLLTEGDIPSASLYAAAYLNVMGSQIDPDQFQQELLLAVSRETVNQLPDKDNIKPTDRLFTFGGLAEGVSGQYVLNALSHPDADQILQSTAFENLTLAIARARLTDSIKEDDHPPANSIPVNSSLPVINLHEPIECTACDGLRWNVGKK